MTEPALVQACLIDLNFATSAASTSFWVTLTFLVEPLYHYDTHARRARGPLMGRHIDRLVLWYATLLAVVLLGVFNAMQLATSGLSIGAAIVVAFALDLFRQPLQAPLARTVLRYCSGRSWAPPREPHLSATRLARRALEMAAPHPISARPALRKAHLGSGGRVGVAEAGEGDKEIRKASEEPEDEDADRRDGEKVLSAAGGLPEKRLEN